MQINCNLVTMVELANDDSCLIYNLSVKKRWRSEKKIKTFPNKQTN